MVKRIVAMCHDHNGTIFGGAARDSYIHDYDARKFCQKYDIEQYNDVEITEFPGRFVVPNDVDCIMLAQDNARLIKRIQRNYHVRVTLDVDANYMSGLDMPYGHYRFHRYSIVDLQAEPIVLQLDMVVQLEGEELICPFKNYDMDVNALWWTRHEMVIHSNQLDCVGRLNDIYGIPTYLRNSIIYATVFENIRLKKATCTSHCSSGRILKMKKKGWDVHYSYDTIQITNDPYDGVCVLCQDTIEGDHSTFQCKCAHICMVCLMKHHRELPKCTICKSSVDLDTLRNDVRIYKAIECGIDIPIWF
jgi:hypothetical protein